MFAAGWPSALTLICILEVSVGQAATSKGAVSCCVVLLSAGGVASYLMEGNMNIY